MPVPTGITAMGTSAHYCGNFMRTFANPQGGAGGRANLTRNFHVYLELTMQSKHDANMRSYCIEHHIEGRRQDGKQVPNSGPNGTAALGGFYVTKSGVAADVACEHMVKKWQNQTAATPMFTPNVRVDASVQNKVQSDGYQYELSYWYDGQDIYVLYHCYPSR